MKKLLKMFRRWQTVRCVARLNAMSGMHLSPSQWLQLSRRIARGARTFGVTAAQARNAFASMADAARQCNARTTPMLDGFHSEV